MGKHSRAIRRTAAVSALTIGAVSAIAAPAQAASVADIPGVDQFAQVPGYQDTVAAVDNAIPADVNKAIDDAAAQGAPAAIQPVADQASFAPDAAPQPTAPAIDAASSSVGQQIVDAARSKIGAPYVYGASGPDSFDCSGLTSWAYSQVGKSIPRTSQAQSSSGTPVAQGDLQPGDIVSFYDGASHVGIYSGNGMIVHASTESVPLSEVPMDSMPFYNAVRF